MIVTQQDPVVDLLPAHEGRDCLPSVIVHRYAEHFKSAIAVLFLELDEPRHLLVAGAAPGRPEIEQNNFAAVIGEVRDIAAGIFEFEVGRYVAILLGLHSLANRPDWTLRSAGHDSEQNGYGGLPPASEFQYEIPRRFNYIGSAAALDRRVEMDLLGEPFERRDAVDVLLHLLEDLEFAHQRPP